VIPRRLRAALGALVLLLLAACATRPAADSQMPWTSGKLSLKVDASAAQPAQAVTASFDLRGTDQRGELRLISPLGTSIATARWAGDRAVLQTSEGERQFTDLEALSREALGESLPLRALPDWLTGRPWAGADIARRDATGFEQLGWKIDLLRFADGVLTATREAAPAVVLRVRIERPD
jgi:outer membrane lipoprotein LolB